jgi:beta-galactosidase GanA
MSSNLSRRDFLNTTAGCISVVGASRFLAGPSLASVSVQGGPEALVGKQFLYGSAFFRPPNPPRGQRREMLKAFAQEYKFNIIRIYLPWVYCNPAPGRFDFEELTEVMSYCDEFGLKVLMGVITEEAPYWLEQAHPETRYVDAKGNPQRLAGSGNNVSGGWPGMCLDWEPVREAAGRFIREMARVVARHPSMYAYDIWNESHIEPAWQRNIWATPQERLYCYCDRTIVEFQRWLERRYGSLEKLNEAWVRRYPNWKAIDPPRAMSTYLDWVDWRRYNIERSTEEMRFRAGHVRAVDSQHVIEGHSGRKHPIDAVTVDGVNDWRLAEVVDVWGFSHFPRWESWPVFYGAAAMDLTRSCSGNKEFWMTELQGGHGSRGLWRSPQMRPRDIRLWNWLAVATGAKGILYWAYHAEATGSEATGFGLVARDGTPTERVLEAAENHRLIQAHWDIIKNHRPRPEVAILTDDDNGLLTYAMTGNEDPFTGSLRGYYKALWNSDLWADFIEPASLGKTDYKVLIVPWHLMGKKDTCGHLRRFVEAGGTLILETAFGMFDERCFYNPVIPPYGLDESFGYREKESYYLQNGTEAQPLSVPRNLPPSEKVYYEPEIEFSRPITTKVRAHTFLTPIEIRTAAPIAHCHGMTVGATKKAGKGEVYYFGTNLGASIMAGDNRGIELLRAIVTRVVPPPVTSDKLRPRLIEGTTRSLLALFNDAAEDQTGSIKLPQRYRRAKDIHENREYSVDQNAIKITVPFQSVSVLLLE